MCSGGDVFENSEVMNFCVLFIPRENMKARFSVPQDRLVQTKGFVARPGLSFPAAGAIPMLVTLLPFRLTLSEAMSILIRYCSCS